MEMFVGSLLFILGNIVGGDAAPLPPGTVYRTVQVGDAIRGYLLHVPADLPEDQPVPLTLAYHGAGLNARIFQMMTQFHQKANQEKFIVAFPNGSGPGGLLLTWNAEGCCGTAAGLAVDDVAFADVLIEDIAQRHRIDRKRVYATGLSNGGMMVYRLASAMPDRLAAVASVAGTLSAIMDLPTEPLPVLHIHGTGDPVVPYRGRADLPNFLQFRSVDDTLAVWRNLNGVLTTPTIEPLPNRAQDGTHSELIRWPGVRPDSAPVWHVRIHNGGHPWPGEALSIPRLGPVATDFKATDIIWDFFRQQRKPL